MELKTLIPIVFSSIIGILGIVLSIYQHHKNKKLNEQNLGLSQRLLNLENEKFNYQITQDAQKELAQEITQKKQIEEEKSDTQLYCDHIIDKFQYLEFTGLDASGQKSLKLEHIYVKLKTRPKPENNLRKTIDDFEQFAQENSDDRYEEENHKDRELANILEESIEQSKRENCSLKMLFTGHPGSGKTTLMKWIALQCASQKIKFLSSKLPIFIALKDLGKDPDGTFKNLGIEKLVKKQLEHESLDSNFFDRHFKKNEVIFLLDGLDEVADEKIRREVIGWIKKQNIRKNTLIVTSRLSGIQAEKGLKFPDAWPVFRIKDFDLEDIEFFLKNWYENVEKAMAKNSEANTLKKAEERYKKLIETIRSDQHEKLRELAVNPLLLTIIAIVHRTRATLPKERHKLYEECVKVMIELWNVANRNLDINFSVENSVNYLSKIAVHLMKENRREASLQVIESILPPKIEDHPVCFFLKEMVLKAGLLYKSEGQYGFLHLTFQEYLAAWNFSKQDNPEEILKYRDKDYWTETFKLFANISNTRRFFNTVLERLETKNYWRQMRLWDSCLRDIAIEDTQLEVELKFAEHIITRLSLLGKTEIEEEIIKTYHLRYPIHEFTENFVEKTWKLFINPKHPFIQTVGALLLSRSDTKTRDKLIKAIKSQIDEFTAISTPTHNQIEDFIFRHNSSFFLLLLTRKKLLDFAYVLHKIKSDSPFIKFLGFRDMRHLQITQNFSKILSPPEVPNPLTFLYKRNSTDSICFADPHYFIRLRNNRKGLSIRCFGDIRNVLTEFYAKYELRIKNNEDKISQWADRALEILHRIPNEEIMRYFPGTTEVELREFREEQRQEKKELQ